MQNFTTYKSRAEEAAQKKKSGKYNCAQAIACTYCDFTGMSEEDIKNAVQAFGVGMGTLDATCGALIGAGMVLGLINKDRNKTVKDVRELVTEFKKRNKSITCKDLKGIESGTVLRECNDCVKDAAEFLETILNRAESE